MPAVAHLFPGIGTFDRTPGLPCQEGEENFDGNVLLAAEPATY